MVFLPSELENCDIVVTFEMFTDSFGNVQPLRLGPKTSRERLAAH